MFEDRVLRGRKWLEAGENCINEELHNLYRSPNIVWEIVYRKMR
jgi:hypothetical protein